MTTTIESEETFLTFDNQTTTVSLNPRLEHENGVYSNSRIVFAMDRVSDLTFTVTIESTIDHCIVDKVGFAIR